MAKLTRSQLVKLILKSTQEAFESAKKYTNCREMYHGELQGLKTCLLLMDEEKAYQQVKQMWLEVNGLRD